MKYWQTATTSTAIIELPVRSTGLFVENMALIDRNNTVLENETSKILWDFNIYTDRAIHHRRPDIVLIDQVDNRVQIIDIAVPWDANIESKYREKVDHYKDLAIELSRLWQKHAGNNYSNQFLSLGCVKSNLDKALKDLSIEVEYHSYTLQKTAVLASAYISRRFLTC